MKRALSIFLTVVLLLSLVPTGLFSITANAATTEKAQEFFGGSGTASDPYLIQTIAHLNNVRTDLSAHYKLVTNIVFNSSGKFKPIGSSSSDAFSGTFDGNGFSIVDIYINETDTEYVGLFGYNTGTIKNLGVVDGSINGDNSYSCYTGGIVGLNYGLVINCYNTSSVFSDSSGDSSKAYAGGIAGCNYETIMNCYNTGEIRGESYTSYIPVVCAGGICGYNSGWVSNCYNIGDISSNLNTWDEYNELGGICGRHVMHNDNSTITRCYYLNTNTFGIGNGEGNVTRCTESKLKQQSTFVGFDFENTWKFEQELTSYRFPVLKNVTHVEDKNIIDYADSKYIYSVVNNIRYGFVDNVATFIEPLSCVSGEVAIPTSITYKDITYSVTGIGPYAFSDCNEVAEIILPLSITNISDGAFENCTGITDVWYEGTEKDKENIKINTNNTPLVAAKWHYNSCIKNNTEHSHTYDYCTDTECNNCANVRKALEHVYDDCYDKSCNACNFIRIDEHKYQNNCDIECDICHYIRVPFDHVYSNDWDTTCNVCGESRVTGEFTITYHLDGGTNALKNPSEYTSEDTIILKDATKAGYDFAGWFLDPDKTEQITEIPLMGNIDVYAKFTPKSYTATFIDNGAATSSILTVTLDDSIGTTRKYYMNNNESISPYSYWVPQRDGYVFLGWYNGTNLVSDSIDIKSNLTLKAKWKLCDQYGSRENPIILGGDSAAIYNVSGDFCSEKLEYDPWEGSTEDLGWDEDSYTSISGSHYIYVYVSGQYSKLNYEGKYGDYYGNGTKAGGFSIYDVTNDKELISLSDNSEWRTSSGSFEVAPGTLLKIGVYYAIYSGYMYYWGEIRVSLGDTRNCLISCVNERTMEQEYDSYINAPSVKKTGYKFLGWYDEQGNQITETWQYTADQTFKAKWQPIKYSVDYVLDGGVNSSSNPSSYTIEDSITLKNPSKPGYTFEGWYSDADFTTRITSISKKSGNITLYAKFEVNSYNLTLDGNEGAFSPKITFISDGTVIKTSYLFEEDSITAYRPKNKDGYIFAGWYKDENCSSLFKFNGTIKSDITLYAKWVECDSNTIDIEALEKFNVVIFGKTEQLCAFVPVTDGKITVTSESDDLDLIGNLYDSSKKVLVSSDDISSTDLDFSYSYDVKAGQLYYIAVKGNTSLTSGDATINIKWTGECTLKGTTYTSEQTSVVYDTNYKLPEKPIREGYVFLGWFDENNTKVTSGLWKFSTDKTLTAKWEQTTYHTVTFKNLEGEIISSDTYYISEDIVAPELPVKAPDETYNYSAKWDNNYTGVCTGDAVYSPIFEPTYIDYTVTFVDEDGKELSKKTYHWGDKIIEPDAPAKASDNIYSYTFGGWDKEVIDCAGDVTYTATYTPKHIDYTVVFKDWDGTVISSETYHWGDKINIPDTPIRPDDENYIYNFVEWDKKVINCEGDETYTAIYDKTAIVVTSIVITSQPDKLVYLEDEDFEKTGMVVVAYYNNDTNEIITDYTISGYDNTVGTKAITVAYGDQTATLTVEVTHNYKWIIDKENNCGVDGIKHEECSVCHSKQNEDTIIPATGEHTYSDAEDIECDVCKYLKAQIGDVDGDGNITIMDATMIQMHIAQLISIGEDRIVCADTDKDGTITIMDATMIQMFIAQLIPEL